MIRDVVEVSDEEKWGKLQSCRLLLLRKREYMLEEDGRSKGG